MWQIITTDVFDQWFAKLKDSEREEIVAVVELLKEMGPRLERPHVGTLSGSQFANMKELRANTATSVIRVAFAFDPQRHAILLAGGEKQGVNQRRFYKSLIRQADALFAAHLAKFRKNGKG